MQNRRLLLGVIIKLMMASGLILLVLVLFNSLFVKEEKADQELGGNKIPTAMLDVAEMQLGQIIKTRWNNKEVAVLLRQFPEKLKQAIPDGFTEKLPNSLDKNTRSINPDYFVYINAGDSKNCPLHYAAGEFKDVCSSNKFDEAGRDISATLHNYLLSIPPHYFIKNSVVFGQWQP